MEQHDLSCFNLETDEFKIKLKKGADLEALGQVLNHTAAPVVAAPATAAAPSPADDSTRSEGDGQIDITAPMVGTFYRAASPETESYVDVGDRVEEETVVCIIEAMKVMNEIQAETRGVITEILVSNTDPVQFGEPLFRVKPD